jgi:site-specific DNA recombinase
VAWDKAEKKFRLVPEEAVVYRQIFDLFIDEHLSYTEIARRLTEEGHLTRKLVGRKGLSRGGVPFTDRRIRFLIESTAAYGEWNRGRLLCRKLKDSARKRNFNSPIYWERKVRRREDWVPIPVPAVVTKERWERAQEIVRTRVRPARNVEAATLLQGFLFCAHCGSRVGPEWPRGKKPGAEARYRCMTQPYSTDRRYRRYQGMSCALPRLRQPDLDRVVWAKVEEWISNPETLWEAAYERGRGARDEAEEKIAGLRKRLTAAKVQEERAARLFTMGVAPETAQGQVREAAARRLAAQKELEVAERAVWAARSREEDRNYAFAVLNAYRGQLGALTLAEKREVLRVLVPAGPEYKIEVAKTGDISITGAIPAEKCVSVPSTPYTAASYET